YYARWRGQSHVFDTVPAQTCRRPGPPSATGLLSRRGPSAGQRPAGHRARSSRQQHLTHTHATSSPRPATPTAGPPRSLVISRGELDPGRHRRDGGRTAAPLGSSAAGAGCQASLAPTARRSPAAANASNPITRYRVTTLTSL